jgi:hypothetical protein
MMFRQYSGVIKMFRRYWHAYGGCTAVVCSPYFHASLVIAVVVSHIWLSPQWWDIVLSTIPNLTGFTLGGFAIIVTFGDEKFKELIYSLDDEAREPDELGEKDKSPTFVATVGSTFVHFILLQVLSLLAALLAKGTYFVLDSNSIFYRLLLCSNLDINLFLSIGRNMFWFIGFELFVYALVTAVAATFSIFRLIYLYQTYIESK